ncbi:hypothetical protein tinsulaeT_04170 [Thalassotalea insulae]|uniref:Sel1 repeat family protein n=2 Tax=Thalassotalea insulae TaxID=2056778 RepID=A0ABQ6GP00_9GAMM|nr:hypothetical protein tinsulaeT_04170 [Thalassotalea insulae]
MLIQKLLRVEYLQSNQSSIKSWLSLNLVANLIKAVVVVFILLYLTARYQQYNAEQNATEQLLTSPKVNDIYFLDFRLISDNLRPNEKYRVAKIFDITGDIVTLRYGDLLFANKHSAEDSVRFGQLRYQDYFQPERINLTVQELQQWRAKEAIYLVKRPKLNKLFGNYVGPVNQSQPSMQFIQGRREYYTGRAHLANSLSETSIEDAFYYFEKSATLGYSLGQVSLAELYLTDEYGHDLESSLYWLERAALQSHKPAILKYGIICQQVENCNLGDFYQMLIENGVNLKVREMPVKLMPASVQ